MALTALAVAPTSPAADFDSSNTMADSAREHLRMRLRRRRRELAPQYRSQANRAINQRLISSDFFHDAQSIAFFAAFDGEPNLDAAIDVALRLRKQVFLPVLPQDAGQALQFARLESRHLTRTNHYGIAEPLATAAPGIAPAALELVITPLVGFDLHGNRLGMGGGYYDRTFAFVANCRHPAPPKLVGVAYDVQKTDCLHPQPWDVPLWRVVTETALYKPAPEPTEK